MPLVPAPTDHLQHHQDGVAAPQANEGARGLTRRGEHHAHSRIHSLTRATRSASSHGIAIKDAPVLLLEITSARSRSTLRISPRRVIPKRARITAWSSV